MHNKQPDLPPWQKQTRRERHREVYVPPLWAWRGAACGAALATVAVVALTVASGAMWWTRYAPAALLLGAVLALPVALLGGAVGLGLDRGFRRRSTALLLAAAVALTGLDAWWLLGPGPDTPLPVPPAAGAVRVLAGPSPAEAGGFAVRTLTYGSGTDRRRPEYGPAAEIKTEPVDASPFLKGWTGLEGRLRTRYWGFGPEQVPVNGRVWYPVGEGPFPLVLLLHGNHAMTVPSEVGYAYLGELLASRGYVVASVDENFLNDSWLGGLGVEANAGRAWVLLQHLKLWQKLNATLGTPFFRRVDMGTIALVGHSRGGEAAYLAAVFNDLPHWPDDAAVPFSFRFNIKAVATLAPTDGQYRPAGKLPELQQVHYLALQGADDADVSAFVASRQYGRTDPGDSRERVKATLYIYGANHVQFNPAWGRRDLAGLPGQLLRTRSLLSAQEQRQIAQVYLPAFLDVALRGRREYLPLLQDWRAGTEWLPRTAYVSRYADATLRPVATFEEDLDLLTTTAPGGFGRGEGLAAWREEGVQLRKESRQENTALYLAWKKGGTYSLTVPDHLVREWSLNRESALTFAVADGRAPAPGLEPLDLTVEVVDGAGNRAAATLAGRAPVLLPQAPRRLLKLGALEDALLGVPGPALQTVVIPLADLLAGTTLDPASVRTVRFTFDRTAEGTMYLDDVGFVQLSR